MFAPEGIYEPAGMFTPAHFISLGICLVVLITSIYFSRNISIKNLKKITFIMAITFTILEIIKICYKFIVCKHSFTSFDSWLPLYYCSLFIYTTWMSISKNNYISKIGDSFISCGCITGGLAFLVSPSTSLMIVPIWHFLSIHSLLFHTSMVYLGFMYIYRGLFSPDKKELLQYTIFLALFMIPAELLNIISGSNMMMLREPFNFPIKLAYDIYNFKPALWTLISVLTYCLVPFAFSCFIYFIINLFRKKKQKTA